MSFVCLFCASFHTVFAFVAGWRREAAQHRSAHWCPEGRRGVRLPGVRGSLQEDVDGQTARSAHARKACGKKYLYLILS